MYFVGSNNCPETADFKLTDFSSRSVMENNGWSFDITDDATTDTGYESKCNMHGTYYGWKFPGVGKISATFAGSGTAKLDYGNCHNMGYVNVHLSGELLDGASANTPSKLFSFNFSPNDVLMLEETDGNTVIKFNSLDLSCGKTF